VNAQLVNASLKSRVLTAREEAKRLKRTRLFVDYDNKERAKELGAKWDPLLGCSVAGSLKKETRICTS
jgi:hypothetical protein